MSQFDPSSASKPAGLLDQWTQFWFMPQQPLGLHVLRTIFGVLTIVWLLSFAGYVQDFFSFDGWFDRTAFSEAQDMVDRQNWSPLYFVAGQPALLNAVYWASIAIVVCFTLGFFTRITSVLTWLIVVSFSANPLIEIDTDILLRIIAFYLMIGYLFLDLQRSDLPLWQRITTATPHWWGTVLKHGGISERSTAPTVAIRLWQVHFALAIVIMGLTKLQHGEWWTGVAYWYPWYHPTAVNLDMLNELKAKPDAYLNFISAASYVVIAWQIFFPAFAWRQGICRWVLLGGAMVGTAGLMIIYPIPLLGPTFFLLCLSYLIEREWFLALLPLLRLVKR